MTEIEIETDVAANRAAWLVALRSGGYAQGVGRLRTRDDGYCCLGVAETIRGAEWRYRLGSKLHAEPDDAGVYLPVVLVDGGFEETFLSVEGRHWLGLTTNDPVVAFRDSRPGYVRVESPYRQASLAELNDTLKLSFAEIADVIADQPLDWTGDAGQVGADVEARNDAHLASLAETP